jgi:DNA-binding NtrC family response regulator
VAVLVALTRCRFWQGRVDEATQLVEHVSDPGSDPAVRPLRRWRARLALAAGDFALGGRLVAGLLNDVCDSGPREAAAVHREAARVRAATGDAESARGHYLAGLRCCRQGRLPAVAVRLRADWLESAAAMAQGRDVGRLVRQLSGVRARAAPLARARIEQALAVVGRGRPAWLREFARRSGFAGLTGDRQGGRVVVDELLELLSICHDESEQTPALERVCRLIKCRLDASSVCLSGEGEVGRLVRVGHRRGPSRALADQAMATGRLVPALRVCDGLEAAAPVRYGGSTIAALSCRWPIDSQVDPGRVEALLSTAAAACAPRVRAVIDVESSPAPAADDLGLAGVSRAIDLVRVAVRRAAAAPFPVLVEGESGSGKELVARAVHHASARRGRRWCALNCAAVTDDLVEAELFGHARGAFTGALTERVGLFEEADGGTLFLDEVGELSPRAQAKLLRAIQEGEVRRIGENLARRVDARIVAATNRPLEGEAAAGRFRADLRYRLEVLRIVVPPLRDRRVDIPVLAARFWAEAAARTGSRATLEPATVDRLTQYHWPGNVRELQNTMAALAVHAPRRGRVGPAWLPPAVRAASGRPEATLEEARRIFEAGFVREALALAGGRRTRAAKALGLSRQGLVKVMARLGIDTTTSPAAATTHVEVSTREPAPRQQTGGPAEPDRRAPRRSDP